MDIKPGKETSEYRFTLIANVALAIIAALAVFGLLASEEARAISGVVLAVVPLAGAYLNGQYVKGRSQVKSDSAFWANNRQAQPPEDSGAKVEDGS